MLNTQQTQITTTVPFDGQEIIGIKKDEKFLPKIKPDMRDCKSGLGLINGYFRAYFAFILALKSSYFICRSSTTS
jgi:hypothetical protein